MSARIAWPDMLWMPSPNRYTGRGYAAVELLVIHYTAGKGDERGVGRVFASPARKASAHFGIGRAGGIAQYVALDDAAWHAGDGLIPSSADLDKGDVPLNLAVGNVNRRSVGIEICNRGWASKGANPRVTARHRNPGCRSTSWESFSPAQYLSLRTLVAPLRERFPAMRFVTGHEDVTHRKTDPGPAFDWNVLRGFGLTRVIYDFAADVWRTEAL
jgi:N-acetylmuramoyl-L-alanine amidase